MLIFDENSRSIILQSNTDPLPVEYFWVLDMEQMDFMLSKIVFVEDTIGPSITLRVNNFDFDVPSFWSLLIYDTETSQLDTVSLKEACGKSFTAVVGSHARNQITGVRVTAVGYSPNKSHVCPALNKHQMLCHPISPTTWINLSPTDTFTKYIKNATIGNLI